MPQAAAGTEQGSPSRAIQSVRPSSSHRVQVLHSAWHHLPSLPHELTFGT